MSRLRVGSLRGSTKDFEVTLIPEAIIGTMKLGVDKNYRGEIL